MFDRWFRRTPAVHAVRIEPAGRRIEVQAGETILQAALRQGVAFPHHCRAGGCGTCKCRLVSGRVKERTDTSYLLSAEELRDHFILACQSEPRDDVVVNVTLGDDALSPPVETTATIVGLSRLCADTMHLQLALADPMTYRGGQCIDIVLPDACPGDQRVRHYSFASAPPEAGAATAADFFVRKVPGGTFTEWLFAQAKVGDRLAASGPHGDFGLRPGTQPMLCIAGGSGLAPIKAMLEAAARTAAVRRDLVLLFGVRTEANLYALDAIDHLSKAWMGRFTFVPVLSTEPPQSAWRGLRGPIADHLRDAAGAHIATYQTYLCGPPPMIDACVERLQAAGMPAGQIFADRFLDRSHTPAANM